MKISKEFLCSVIEYTRVKGTDTIHDVRKVCEEALKYNFAAVCINPFHVESAHSILKGSNVEVCTGIGFPLGANTLEVKLKEINEVIRLGANAVDFVINYSALKSGMWNVIEKELMALVKESHGVTSKAIIETCYLTKEEIYRVSQMAALAGVGYVKTSTGMGPAGATVEDIKIIQEAVDGKCKIKAAGGISTLQQVFDFLQAGASRIGTSRGVEILNELDACNK
jgi:deoxyribose-phosphate aldolase